MAKQPKEYLRRAIAGLTGKLQASLGASGPLGDSLSKGELREEDVVAAFRPHIPQRYELVKGVVVNSSGEESLPQDILLFDTTTLPPILGTGNTRIVPVEGVVGTIQVKSIPTKASIENAIANVASAKRLLAENERYGTPLAGSDRRGFWSPHASFFGGILCLTPQGNPQELVTHYVKCVSSLPGRERCDVLCIIDGVSVMGGNPSNGDGLHLAWRAEEAEAPVVLWTRSDSLLFFYTSLVEHLNNWISPPIRWLDYVVGPDRSRTTLEFQYSYWVDD